MKFVLNTSFDPHFCALFDETDQLLFSEQWIVPKEDGKRIWDFLQRHLTPESNFTFIGGVSGPGSFASLRAGGAILNSLSFKYGIPIHHARADKVIQDFLKEENKADQKFLLNSFSKRVFTIKNQELKATQLENSALDKTSPVITSWLPEIKASQFENRLEVDPFGPVQSILKTLANTTPEKIFVPDYEYPAVQN